MLAPVLIPPTEWLAGDPTPMRIVGLVEDVVQTRVEEGPRASIYVPYTQRWGGAMAVIRSTLPTEAIVPELRRAAARFNPRVPPSDAVAIQDRLAATRTNPRFQTLLISAFALVATLMAASGLYGSLAHSVGRLPRAPVSPPEWVFLPPPSIVRQRQRMVSRQQMWPRRSLKAPTSGRGASTR